MGAQARAKDSPWIAAVIMADWATSLEENLFADAKACYAAWIGDETTGLIGCAQKDVPYADEGGPWTEVFSDPSEREITGEDGEPKKVSVDETAIYWEIQQCFANNKEIRTGNFPGGIWFGGRKYTVTQQDKTESDPPIPFVNLALKGQAKAGEGGGCTISYYGGYLVCGFFKKPAQDSGNCNIAVTTYAPTLAE